MVFRLLIILFSLWSFSAHADDVVIELPYIKATLINSGNFKKLQTREGDGRSTTVYDDGIDRIIYEHIFKSQELKEWIFARKPNFAKGSCYEWEFQGTDVNLSMISNNTVGIYEGKNIRGKLEPIVYWNKKGHKHSGRYIINSAHKLTIEIEESAQDYPLKIDPTIKYGQFLGSFDGLISSVTAVAVEPVNDEIYAGGSVVSGPFNQGAVTIAGTIQGNGDEAFVAEIKNGSPPVMSWLQWLGGDGTDTLAGLAVTGDEIYAGGKSTSSTANWETVGSTAGTYSGGSEGFVVEIADGATPTLNWMQWLGSDGSDTLAAMAVTGDEIYAGGNTTSSTANWETVGSVAGTYSGSTEGWVVEIADGGPPGIAWLQWLGSDGTETLSGLALTGDEIYASGYTQSSTANWETVGSMAGTYSGGSEGWVVVIADGGPPSVNWLQWLGSDGDDANFAIAVTGNEIYAGGYSFSSTANWETMGAQAGTYTASIEGWVVEIADGGPPGINWLQWLGSSSTDQVNGLAVVGDEIYAAGVLNSFDTGFETVGSIVGTANGGSEAFVVEIADGATPAVNWVQWLGQGGGSGETATAVAVNGDEVFTGGIVITGSSMDTANSVLGVYGNNKMGFVAQITDGGPPSLTWLQWLGGIQGTTTVDALAITGSELYAGGHTFNSSWTTAYTVRGTFEATALISTYGFVMEIADTPSSSVNWFQWLGSNATNQVLGLAVTGDEIYAGGTTSSSTASWQTVGSTAGTYSGNTEAWVVEIADGATPSLNWQQWLGSDGLDGINAVAVTGDEIYAGGYTTSSTANWETVGSVAGTYSGGQEGWVVEIADGGPPSVAWQQWLGSNGADNVGGLAVTGDEIYVGGSTQSSTANWETVGSTAGTYSGGFESWVVEIADGGPPSIAWQQWLGSDGDETFAALAVTGDEIYAGGYSFSSTANFETVGQTAGTYSGFFESWVVEIADGSPPGINWLQWLGSSSTDLLKSLAVTGDEIYAAVSIASFYSTVETAGTVYGTADGGGETMIAEIKDGTTPSLNWIQWLGGIATDSPYAIVVQGDEIFTSGSTTSDSSWEITMPADHGVSNGYVIALYDPPTPTENQGSVFFGFDY